VWFHGNAQPGNLLLDSAGRLHAVIDFGTSGIGDPACDTTIAWTFLSGHSVLVRKPDTDPNDADFTKNVISKILADHRDAR
jgi:aminoglycoside phosphotransferase (APT) family kinase protein